MTPEEREQLEKDYPQFNISRLFEALIWCGIVALGAWLIL